MSLFEQAKKAGTISDQTDTTKAEFKYEPAPAGFTTARLVGYVEIGKQPQRPYQGQEKPPAPEAYLFFEFNGPKHITEYEVDGEKRTRTNIHREKVKLSTSERSNYYKLLKKMIGGRPDIKHMAEMLGEGFLIKVSHNVSEKDGKKNTYVNIKDESGWNVGLPQTTDPITNEVTTLDVPAATASPKLLLWDSPSKEQWDSIFIDGSYTRKEGDEEVEVSKNYIQQQCLDASNYVGSTLEAFLSGGDDIAAELSKAPDTKPEEVETVETVEETVTIVDTSEVPAEDNNESVDDVLADLGLG